MRSLRERVGVGDSGGSGGMVVAWWWDGMRGTGVHMLARAGT